MTDGWSIL